MGVPSIFGGRSHSFRIHFQYPQKLPIPTWESFCSRNKRTFEFGQNSKEEFCKLLRGIQILCEISLRIYHKNFLKRINWYYAPINLLSEICYGIFSYKRLLLYTYISWCLEHLLRFIAASLKQYFDLYIFKSFLKRIFKMIPKKPV